MQLRPLLTKLKLKFQASAAKFRPPIRPASSEDFFRKHWMGNPPAADYFSSRNTPRFFFDVKDRAAYSDILKKRFPRMAADVCIAADKFCENRFDILGSGEISLGEEINWSQDFKSRFEWPLKHYTKIKIVDLTNSADVKTPWELSRLQFLTTLGRAYWISGDTRFRDKFISIIADWHKKNPVDYGVNWTCSMEVATRAINIIWGIYFFAMAGELPDNLTRQVIHSLYYHALHIEKNLEIVAEGANSNHLLADYLGLFYVGLLFPEFDKSAKWLKIGKEGLEDEILLQVNRDGGDYECSLSYHRLALEMFLSVFILGKINQIDFCREYSERVAKMIEFSAAMISQSGAAPAIGDNDDGFIVKLARDNPHDHGALLDVGAQIIDTKVPENVGLSEERLWYLGPEALKRWPAILRRKSHLFKESGFAVIQNDRMHLVFNANGITERAFGGHKHNDLLSVNLEINGVPFLIDAGTACYTSDYQMRNKSRSTEMHNTICVNDKEQNRFLEKALFFMYRDAHPKIDLWTVTDSVVIVSGFHDGYARFGNSIIHRRTLEVSLPDKKITICDEITGQGKEIHLFESNFLTPWGCHKDENDYAVTIVGPLAHSIQLNCESSDDLHFHTYPAEYYPRYGTVKTGTRISLRCRTKLPFKSETRLVYDKADNLQDIPNRIAYVQKTI